jgi:hypothetical protein
MPARRPRAVRPLARGRELRHGPHRGVRRGHARGGVRDRRLQRHRRRWRRRCAGAAGRRTASRRGAAGPRPRPPAPDSDEQSGAGSGRALCLATHRERGARGVRTGPTGVVCDWPPGAVRAPGHPRAPAAAASGPRSSAGAPRTARAPDRTPRGRGRRLGSPGSASPRSHWSASASTEQSPTWPTRTRPG